jgi:hypothetical protein
VVIGAECAGKGNYRCHPISTQSIVLGKVSQPLYRCRGIHVLNTLTFCFILFPLSAHHQKTFFNWINLTTLVEDQRSVIEEK